MSLQKNDSPLLNGRRRFIATLAMLCGAFGCATEQSITIKPPAPDDADDIVEPVIHGGYSGLEMRRWIVQDRGEELATALQPYATSIDEISVEDRRHLQANGFRVARVPLTSLPEVRESLTLTGRIDRHWFGQAPKWTDMMVGLNLRESAVVQSSAGAAEIDGGRFRLLTRAWTTPTDRGPRLHVDLALQLAFEPKPTAFEAKKRTSIGEAGPVYDALSVSALLEPGYAYLIASERPDVPWGEEAAFFASDTEADAAGGFGPVASPTPTVGELMLSETVESDAGVTRYRQVIVLTPRLPNQFRLIE